MKQWFLNLLGGLTDKLISFMSSKWALIGLFFINPFIAIGYMIAMGVQKAEAYFNTMMDEGTNMFGQVTTLNGGTMIGIANAFIPLEVIFTSVTALLSLWLISVAYRAIKSFIPTLS